jgi:hypothetical protein
MSGVDLNLIQEINKLWYPVFPYLVRHVSEIYDRQDGRVLDIGPFSGVSFWLVKEGVGTNFRIASFPRGMADLFRSEVRGLRLEREVNVVESSPALDGIEDSGADLAVFRGAFFFPSIFEIDLRAIHRVLGPGGVGFVGGGFGKYTPNEVILSLGKRSRELNLSIGKIELGLPELTLLVDASGLGRDAQIVEEGGLWVLIRKRQ